MSLLDGLLNQVAQNTDIKNLAAKVGLTPAQVEQGIQALAKGHAAPTDTVDHASKETGLPPSALSKIVEQLGGEGALGRFANMMPGGGGATGSDPMDMIGKIAGGFMGGKK